MIPIPLKLEINCDHSKFGKTNNEFQITTKVEKQKNIIL